MPGLLAGFLVSLSPSVALTVTAGLNIVVGSFNYSPNDGCTGSCDGPMLALIAGIRVGFSFRVK